MSRRRTDSLPFYRSSELSGLSSSESTLSGAITKNEHMPLALPVIPKSRTQQSIHSLNTSYETSTPLPPPKPTVIIPEPKPGMILPKGRFVRSAIAQTAAHAQAAAKVTQNLVESEPEPVPMKESSSDPPIEEKISEVNELYSQLKKLLQIPEKKNHLKPKLLLQQQKKTVTPDDPADFTNVIPFFLNQIPPNTFPGARIIASEDLAVLTEWYISSLSTSSAQRSQKIRELFEFIGFLLSNHRPETLETDDHILLAEALADLRIHFTTNMTNQNSILFNDYVALKQFEQQIHSSPSLEKRLSMWRESEWDLPSSSSNSASNSSSNSSCAEKWNQISSKYGINTATCPAVMIERGYKHMASQIIQKTKSTKNQQMKRQFIREFLIERDRIHSLLLSS
jgi:hypothetical protein